MLDLELSLVKLAKRSYELVFDSVQQMTLVMPAGLFVSWHLLLEHLNSLPQKLPELHQLCAKPWFDDRALGLAPQHQASPK